MTKRKVLFLCTHNSARSQLAEGILRHLAPDRFEVKSAGSHPSEVNPYAIQVLDENGIDISSHYSKSILEFINDEFDYVVTVCSGAEQSCPVFGGSNNRIRWSLKDPSQADGKENTILAFKNTRNMLKALILDFIKDKLECAELKCPHCRSIQEIGIPKDKCLAFYNCNSCGKIISTPESACCIVCSWSDKVCSRFLKEVAGAIKT